MNKSKMMLRYRNAESHDMARCIAIRGMTRDNPMTTDELTSIGVSFTLWSPRIKSGEFLGEVCQVNDVVVGFCFSDVESGEILVLAVLPQYEGMGIGTKLLAAVCGKLVESGLNKLWLAASPDPNVRAHGFYRFLGWAFTGNINEYGDQILVSPHFNHC